MAKEIPIIIKVNGKELDVVKTSVNEFNKIYTETQKKLNDLPLGSDEWKKLNSELKNADKTFNQTKEILTETEGKFKSLKVQIRQATIAFQEAEEKGDIKSMRKLKGDLDELNDQFEITTLKAMKFEDALATMPGVAGFVGQSIQGIDKAFKVLVANPILAVVTALVGAFMFLKEALGKTKEGQAALNKVSQAFSSVMGPILALINTVAVPIFEKLAMIIGKVGQAFAFVAEKLGVSKGQIEAATKDIDKVGQEAADKEKERLEELKKQKEEEKQKRNKY
jgi:septal ring factor EnvC (AmiA/AmiB activator)